MAKVNVHGKEYEMNDGIICFLDSLVKTGDLIKNEEGYWWTKQHIQKCIKGAKHIYRYCNNPFYRFAVDIWRSILNLTSSF